MSPNERAAMETFLREFAGMRDDMFLHLRDGTIRLMVRDIEKRLGVGWRFALGFPVQEMLGDVLVEMAAVREEKEKQP